MELTQEEKNEIIKTLPKFKYNPNVYDNGIVIFNNGICQCCGKNVKAYLGFMYSKEEVNCICLDCVADGSAAEKFDGEFIEYPEKRLNEEAFNELMHRTPGYVSSQGENWLDCCDDYCEFIGEVGTQELIEKGIVDEVFDELKQNGKFQDIEWLKERLKINGSITGYLFKCRKCGKHHLDVDMD